MRPSRLTALVLAIVLGWGAAPAFGQSIEGEGPTVRTPSERPAPADPQPEPAPTPSNSVPSPGPAGGGTAGSTGVVRGARGDDLLAGNGLQSPWCARPWSAQARANCELSGQASTGAVGNRWSWDIHVDTQSWTGAPRPGDTFIAMLLELMRFFWGLLVAVTRGCFWLVEFALGYQPLDASGQAGLARQLDRAADTITRPLALLLAPVGAVWLAWTGVQRRRQGEALQQLALMAVLGALCVVVLHNPVSTINTLATSGQQLGLAVIGAASGSPSGGERAAQSGLGAMGKSVIDQPLALLQFGDVAFGTDPDRLSPELKKAALTRALKEKSPTRIAAVRAARTNLELFTAWPVGAGARNSINDEDSLLRVMCGADDTEKCEGPMARYAEFRTESGTWDRMVGLIVVLVPMLPLWVILAVTAVLMMAAQVMVVIRTVQLLFVAALSTAGKAGTERVVSYAGELLGDLLAAFKHAAFLALVLVVWRLFSAEVGTGAIGQWMVLAVALVVLLVKREVLWGFARNRPQQNAGAALATRMAAAWAVRSAARTVTGGASAVPGVAMNALSRGGTGRRSGGGSGRAGRLLRAATAGPMAPHLGAKGTREQPSPGNSAGGGGAGPAVVPGLPSRSQERVGAVAVPPGGGVEVPAQADRLGQARSDRARRVRAVMDERDALIAQRRLTPEGEAAERTRLARQRGDLARSTELRAVERDPRKRLAMRKREVSLERRIGASERRLAQSQAAARRGGEPAAVRRRQANQWLREQANRPAGQQDRQPGAGEGRNYPVLAAVAGSSVAEYQGATSLQQAAIRAKVDRELTRHRKDGRVIAKDLARTQRDRGAAPTGSGDRPYRKEAGRHADRRPGRAS